MKAFVNNEGAISHQCLLASLGVGGVPPDPHPAHAFAQTSPSPPAPGPAVGLATFTNFLGMAIGALAFRGLMVRGFGTA
jgi:hypothetical protein